MWTQQRDLTENPQPAQTVMPASAAAGTFGSNLNVSKPNDFESKDKHGPHHGISKRDDNMGMKKCESCASWVDTKNPPTTGDMQPNIRTSCPECSRMF